MTGNVADAIVSGWRWLTLFTNAFSDFSDISRGTEFQTTRLGEWQQRGSPVDRPPAQEQPI